VGPLLLLLLLPLLLAPSVGVACCRGKSTTLDMVGCDESAIPYADYYRAVVEDTESAMRE